MLCPVCNVKIELNLSSSKEEIYWDCANCSSSLLLKEEEGGEVGVEILSQGHAPENNQENAPENTQGNALENTQGNQPKELEEESSPATPDSAELSAQSDEGFSSSEDVIEDEEGGSQDTKADPSKLKETSPLEEEEEAQRQVPEPPDSVTPASQELEEESPVEDQEFNPTEDPSAESEPMEHSVEEASSSAQDESAAELEGSATADTLGEVEDFAFTEGAEDEEPSAAQEESEKPQDESTPSSEKPEGEDFSEVVEFGKNQNQDRQGPYLYDLILKDINSKDTRDKVLSVLDDTYLNLPLSAEELSIKDGCLTLPKISPIQTYVIVYSLMGLAISITWKQTHIADS